MILLLVCVVGNFRVNFLLENYLLVGIVCIFVVFKVLVLVWLLLVIDCCVNFLICCVNRSYCELVYNCC